MFGGKEKEVKLQPGGIPPNPFHLREQSRIMAGELLGKMLVFGKKMATDVVLMQFVSNIEVNEAPECMRNQPSSPFLAIDKWMEVLGSPNKPRWLKISGVPMHAWREGVF